MELRSGRFSAKTFDEKLGIKFEPPTVDGVGLEFYYL